MSLCRSPREVADATPQPSWGLHGGGSLQAVIEGAGKTEPLIRPTALPSRNWGPQGAWVDFLGCGPGSGRGECGANAAARLPAPSSHSLPLPLPPASIPPLWAPKFLLLVLRPLCAATSDTNPERDGVSTKHVPCGNPEPGQPQGDTRTTDATMTGLGGGLWFGLVSALGPWSK